MIPFGDTTFSTHGGTGIVYSIRLHVADRAISANRVVVVI